ncbi:MAG: hypothetical protein H7095_01135 [Pseudopedobacter sp.]|nr:hypothetical protein [Deinococcales bacterium]
MIELDAQNFNALLESLLERKETLIFRKDAGKRERNDEDVDLYVFSGHLEALRSDEIDGDVWGTLEDLEYEAGSEDEAWELIKGFYLERGCTLLKVNADEYILNDVLARKLGLVS